MLLVIMLVLALMLLAMPGGLVLLLLRTLLLLLGLRCGLLPMERLLATTGLRRLLPATVLLRCPLLLLPVLSLLRLLLAPALLRCRLATIGRRLTLLRPLLLVALL